MLDNAPSFRLASFAPTFRVGSCRAVRQDREISQVLIETAGGKLLPITGPLPPGDADAIVREINLRSLARAPR